jgi:hypothetical protein
MFYIILRIFLNLMHDEDTFKQNTTMKCGFFVLPNNAPGQIIELDAE